MIYKFGVIRTLIRDGRLFVCGSPMELGSWDPDCAIPLEIENYILDEPSFWRGEIVIDSSADFEYKYVTKFNDGTFEWEGCGEKDNRRSSIDDWDTGPSDRRDRILLKPSAWKDPDGRGNEKRHTTKFYYDRVVKDGLGLHFSKILDNLWLGSCPRHHEHLRLFRSMNINAIMNLQTEEDMHKNSYKAVFSEPGHSSCEVIDRFERIYKGLTISFVWLPTTDMSTSARRRMIPKAVFILKTLLENGRTVYVHCNAGIGRAGAVVAAYFMYIKDMTLKQMMYYLYDKRPAVFVDRQALIDAKQDYILKYQTRVERDSSFIVTL